MKTIHKRSVDAEASPARKRCRGGISESGDGACLRLMTHAETAVQWGRAVRSGISKASATALMPRCQKCITQLLASAKTPNVT